MAPDIMPSAGPLIARLALVLVLALNTLDAKGVKAHYASEGPLLVVGSINVDTTVHLDHLPMRSETKIALRPSPTLAVGGKGANQAVAAAMLSAGTGRPAARFVCRLGDDAYLPWLQAELRRAGVDTSASRVVSNMSTGAGIVWLDAEGAATSVVLGGANQQGWSLLRPSFSQGQQDDSGEAGTAGIDAEKEDALLAQHAAEVVAGGVGDNDNGGGSGRGLARRASVLLLQREVPERVNEAFTAAAAAAGIPVLLDAGGEDRPVSRRLLSLVDYLTPNEQELQRLTGGMPTGSEEEVAAAAGVLMAGGACNVLVTLEGRGSLLVLGQVEEQEAKGSATAGGQHRRCRPVRAIRQPALPVPGGIVVDATAAGDAFRAALAVALVEGRGRRVRAQQEQEQEQQAGDGDARAVDFEEALRFAAAAGAIAVSRMGAMPSLPTRAEVEQLLAQHGDSPTSRAWDAPELLAAAVKAAAAAADAAPAPASAAAAGTASTIPAADPVPSTDATATSSSSNGAESPGACDNPDPAILHVAPADDEAADAACPLLFGSRLNSMKARRDLLDTQAASLSAASSPSSSSSSSGERLKELLRDNGPLGWVARQGLVASAAAAEGDGGRGGSGGGGAPSGGHGLSLVYFNYPEHLKGLTLQQVLDALTAAGLRPGGVAMRFPAEPFRAGAFTNPNATLRAAAVELATEGCAWAAQLAAATGGAGGRVGQSGAGGHLVVWSAYDGYDYHLQADYSAAWSAAVAGYRQLADACAAMGVAVSLEPKPTDPSSRFSFLPNTASALAFVTAVDRPNMGLTLDTGHMLMAGECLAQGVAEVAAAGRLFGLHLNDGHGRLGAEDGLVFGSVHGAAALELVYYLRYKLPVQPAGPYSASSHTDGSGTGEGRGGDGSGSGRGGGLPHAFFDTFPLNEDPVAEAETNVAAFRALWARAGRLRRAGMEGCLARHDALCSLRLMASVP